MDNKRETALTVRGKTPAIYNKTSQVTAIQRAEAGVDKPFGAYLEIKSLRGQQAEGQIEEQP